MKKIYKAGGKADAAYASSYSIDQPVIIRGRKYVIETRTLIEVKGRVKAEYYLTPFVPLQKSNLYTRIDNFLSAQDIL